jgi:ectoine hydroxylase-related dioxygenase (phytanoyl-CoA dioxygenase family)
MQGIDIDAVSRQLAEEGYAIVKNVLSNEQVQHARMRVSQLMEQELAAPFHPRDGVPADDEAEIKAYFQKSYDISDAEAERMVARTRHDRSLNANTPWPVPINKVSKNFLHLPTLFDQDKSQRVWNLINKAPDLAPLIEHPVVLPMVRQILGQDCNLHDFQSTSIGPHTAGGSWHVDAPLGQIAEPLPEFPLTIQNVWLLDDFTEHNGATRVMPRSHKLRKSPPWGTGPLDGEVTLTAPAGSVAIWLSNTWHRSGPNTTDKPRRAILCNYNLSWLRTFCDFTSTMSPEVAATLSDDVRYLLGYSANAPRTR